MSEIGICEEFNWGRTSSILDALENNSVDVSSAMNENFEERFVKYPECALRDILVGDGAERRVIVLSDFTNLMNDDDLMRDCRNIVERLDVLPMIGSVSKPVIVRSLFGSYNYCGMSNEDDYDSLFDLCSAQVYAFRAYTLAVSFVPECRTYYGVIRLLHTLHSVFLKRDMVKLVIPKYKGKRFNYAVDLNARFLRDLELWSSRNKCRSINSFPYCRLFEYILNKSSYSYDRLSTAVDRYERWCDRCIWVDDDLD